MFLDYLFFELTKKSLNNKERSYTWILRAVTTLLTLNLFTIYLCAERVSNRLGYYILVQDEYVFLGALLVAVIYTYNAYGRSDQIFAKYSKKSEKEDMSFALIYIATSIACFLIITLSSKV